MVIAQLAESGQDTRDNIGARDSTRDILLKRNNEAVFLEENTTRIQGETLGHSFVLGSTGNGKLGTNIDTQDGQQQVLGSAGRVAGVIRVVNPNNTFREHFRDATFHDTNEPATAYWDTTNFKLAMTDSDDQKRAYNTIATSTAIFVNNKVVTRATFNADETKYENDIIKYYLSADNGVNWEEVTLGVEHTFTNNGTTLKFRVVFIGNGSSSTWIENIRINYSTT